MKILHININYMGTPLHQTMIRHLNAFTDNTVFAPVWKGFSGVVEPDSNVIVSECFNHSDRYLFDYKQGKIYKALCESADINRFDLIHAYTVFSDGNCAMRISKKTGIPYVVAVRNTDLNTFFKKAFFLRRRGLKVLLNAKAVFFLSPSYREQLLENYIPGQYREEIERKTYIIPNGIDDYWLQNRAKKSKGRQKEIEKSKELKVVSVGTVSRGKNFAAVADALDILRAEGWKVGHRAIGKIKDQREYEKLMLHEDTQWIDNQPKERLRELYRAADLLAVLSKTETFGLVYAEAMSQGLPVVYSKGQGFDGQFEEGIAGYAAVSDDPSDIAGKILQICDNYDKISAGCTENVKKFDWNAICTEYIRIYNTSLKAADNR